jgi:hypothetical protein
MVSKEGGNQRCARLPCTDLPLLCAQTTCLVIWPIRFLSFSLDGPTINPLPDAAYANPSSMVQSSRSISYVHAAPTNFVLRGHICSTSITSHISTHTSRGMQSLDQSCRFHQLDRLELCEPYPSTRHGTVICVAVAPNRRAESRCVSSYIVGTSRRGTVLPLCNEAGAYVRIPICRCWGSVGRWGTPRMPTCWRIGTCSQDRGCSLCRQHPQFLRPGNCCATRHITRHRWGIPSDQRIRARPFSCCAKGVGVSPAHVLAFSSVWTIKYTSVGLLTCSRFH